MLYRFSIILSFLSSYLFLSRTVSRQIISRHLHRKNDHVYPEDINKCCNLDLYKAVAGIFKILHTKEQFIIKIPTAFDLMTARPFLYFEKNLKQISQCIPFYELFDDAKARIFSFQHKWKIIWIIWDSKPTQSTREKSYEKMKNRKLWYNVCIRAEIGGI